MQAEGAGRPGFAPQRARAAVSIVTAFALPEMCSGKDSGFLRSRGKAKKPKTPLAMESTYLNPEFEVQPKRLPLRLLV